MDTILTIINVAITITALILCIRAWRGLRAVSKPKSRTVGVLSPLDRRKKALELATKAWLYSVERGLTFGESQEREVVERLEREVAALEDELFGTKEEATLKAETPKHVTTVRDECNEVWGKHYLGTCSACGWSWASYSDKTATEKGVEHERKHV